MVFKGFLLSTIWPAMSLVEAAERIRIVAGAKELMSFHLGARCKSGVSSGETRRVSKKHLGRHAEQDLPDLFEMSAACLDLLRERVHVAEAALERAAWEDRVDAGSLVGE